MSRTTYHGDNIADQIQGEDAYGDGGILTYADVWNILDNLYLHFLDTAKSSDPMLKILADAKNALELLDDELPPQ